MKKQQTRPSDRNYSSSSKSIPDDDDATGWIDDHQTIGVEYDPSEHSPKKRKNK